MVEAGKVEQSMEHQDLDLDRECMSLLASLALCGGHSNGEIACDFPLVLEQQFGRKREDVGGLVDTSELPIKPPDRTVGGEQDGDPAPETDGCLGFCKET